MAACDPAAYPVKGTFRAEQLFAGYGEAEILHGLDFELPSAGISVLVGPGGSGKTTLLHLLAKRPIPGLWSRGRLESPGERSHLVLQPTIPRPVGGQKERPCFLGRCADLFKTLDGNWDLLLLDEPVDVLEETCQEAFAAALRRHQADRAEQPVVLATHNLLFCRRVADYVVFLADGRLVEAATASDFFERPQQERTRSFLRTGS